ncbi:hypothetical protein [Arthrobacter subterraneus]
MTPVTSSVLALAHAERSGNDGEATRRRRSAFLEQKFSALSGRKKRSYP